jgi:(p)ppGpp synthase/HD superfamily hydrolase
MAGSEGRPTTTRKEAPISDIALILKAAEFAAHKHRKQRRKGRTKRPYIGHCTEVAWLIAEVGKIEDASVLAAALLSPGVKLIKLADKTSNVREIGLDPCLASIRNDPEFTELMQELRIQSQRWANE